MSKPVVVSLVPGSPAERSGILVGDTIETINGLAMRDIIEYRLAVDDADPEFVITRGDSGDLSGHIEIEIVVEKPAGQAMGIEVQSALFDQLRTCDNHCSFCFIYQLPKGLRESLYLKDDDYRLSFLYGNFTTLTRFTEADFERVVTERLSPLHVSIHATTGPIRSEMLRNRRGAMSLRWIEALLAHGIEIHGQLVICPDQNNGSVLEDTLGGILDRFPGLASLHAVPLGISRFNTEPGLRFHTKAEACEVIDTVERWQQLFLETLGRRLVFASDEYYLMAGREFPHFGDYEDFAQYENGVGMVRTFERELLGEVDSPTSVASGFFAWVEGAPAEGYRAPRTEPANLADKGSVSIRKRPSPNAPVAILTGAYGAAVLGPMIELVAADLNRSDVRVVAVNNEFFGGNTAVAGLMVGADIARTLEGEPEGHRYLLPDVCLSKGKFLDGMTPPQMPRYVEVIETNGVALRKALTLDSARV